MRSLAVILIVVAVLGGMAYLFFMGGSSDTLEPLGGTQTTQATQETPEPANIAEPNRTVDEAPTQAPRIDLGAAAEQASEQYDSGLHGRVLNEAGEPVEGALMTLAYADEVFVEAAGIGGLQRQDRTTETLEDGTYKFDNAEPANYYVLHATHPMFGSARLDGIKVAFRAYEQQPDIVLALGSALTGNILDPAGNPIMGAKVTLGTNLFARNGSKRDNKTVETNDLGRFVILDISGGTYTFMAKADGYATHVLNGLPFDGEKPRTRDVTLEFSAGIAGIVVDQAGSPIKSAEVIAIRYKNSKLITRDSWITKADGKFELSHLEEGDFTVLVNAPGYGAGRQNVVPTGTNNVTIELMKRAAIRGTVVSAIDGSSIPNGKVLLREVIEGTEITNPTSIKGKFTGGEFELENVPAGDYLVEASAIMKGFAPTFSQAFTVVEGQDLEGVLVQATRGAEVVGMLKDSEGKPIANAQVSTEDRAGYLPGWPTNIIPQKVRTDSAGRFKLRALKPETYQIKVTAAGFVDWSKQDIVITEGQDKDLGLITLSRGGTVTGSLTDTRGAAVVGGPVYLRLTDAGVVPRRYSDTSLNDGLFTMENVQPGNYTLWSVPMGVDGPAPGGQRTEVTIYVRDNQVTRQDISLDFSTVRTFDGRPARGEKYNPKENANRSSSDIKGGRGGAGKGGKGGKGGRSSGGAGATKGEQKPKGTDTRPPR